jgi:hypothetical protein
MMPGNDGARAADDHRPSTPPTTRAATWLSVISTSSSNGAAWPPATTNWPSSTAPPLCSEQSPSGWPICQTRPSRNGTHQAPPSTSARIDEAVALSSPAVVLSARLDRYYGHLRRPPGSLPLPSSSPVIGRHAPPASRNRMGRGGPLQFPPPLSERSEPLAPGSPSRLHLQDLHRFHGLRPSPPGSALPCPTRLRAGLLTTRQASLDVTDRSVAHPRSGALDTGLLHRPFPDDTASLLPGLLIATRTGLTPASDDELTNQPSTTYMINHQPFWTHWRTEMTHRFAVWHQIIAAAAA